MKTLVKYVDPKIELTCWCRGFKSVTLPAYEIVRAGLGDNTVENGQVGCSKDQMQYRLGSRGHTNTPQS